MNNYAPRKKKTFLFFGVTTGRSSIMRVFPLWSRHLGVQAVIEGFDFPLHDQPRSYREAVQYVRSDPNVVGGLVTTHKLDLYRACRDLFDRVGPYARLLSEVSSISKHNGALWAHAKDPITSGLALEAILAEGHWSRTGADLCLLGAGGSSLALTLYLIRKQRKGGDVPRRVVVTNRSSTRLGEMREIHRELDHQIQFAYHLCPQAKHNDQVIAQLAPQSLVANATGLGKDAPGSPLTDDALFPEGGIAWDFNYRGDLVFLAQAAAQRKTRGLSVQDGWVYFIHGWTRCMAEVFHIEIPSCGPGFQSLADMAATVRENPAP
jgi:shikimate 5-dehydrogenase